MNKYIVPICNIQNSKVYNKIINASSNRDCQDKLMEIFSEKSKALNWPDFLEDLDKQDILIGKIIDIEEL